MRKEAQGVLKSFPAPPRPLRNSLQFSKILSEKGDNLIGFSVVQRTDHNGICREERHKETISNPKSLPAGRKVFQVKNAPQLYFDQTILIWDPFHPMQGQGIPAS